MAYKIKWTPEAEVSFDTIITYLLENFSENEVKRFVVATEMKISLIEANPNMYRQSSKYKTFRYTNILKKTILVYRVKKSTHTVELIHFWDGRQNSSSFKT